MIFIPVRVELLDGTFTVQVPIDKLSKPYKIGLVELNLASINEDGAGQNSIDIIGDQIDSTVWNPKRLLKRICFNKTDRNEFFNNWQARIIEFHPVDSRDGFLSFRVQRTHSKRGNDCSVVSTRSRDELFLTMALMDADSA